MSNLYIIKLGGSVITAKEENKFEVKEEALARISSEIQKALKKKKFSLIVVHGAGPFGHTNVSEYDINNGVFSERQKEGLRKTISDCNFLDSRVIANLKEAGIDAVAFDPNKIIVQENKKIIDFDITGIMTVLSQKKVPVLFGQMVPDTKLNASVVSGDAIVAFLAKKFKPKKILLGTDVSGIFTEDPQKNPKAKRIPIIDKKNFNKIIEKVGEAGTIDVTQGMKGKLLKLKEQLSGTNAIIFNANEKNSFFKALSGGKIKCTEIKL